MKRAKLALAVVSMVVSAAVTAALWPNARDALAVLQVQDDPAALADLRLNSALRNSPLLAPRQYQGGAGVPAMPTLRAVLPNSRATTTSRSATSCRNK